MYISLIKEESCNFLSSNFQPFVIHPQPKTQYTTSSSILSLTQTCQNLLPSNWPAQNHQIPIPHHITTHYHITMKFSSTLFLLTAPLLVTANWTYKLGGKTFTGGGSTGCKGDTLHKGTDWSWENRGSSCRLYMYGDKGCTGKQGFNFQTRGDRDRGNANTDHQAWKVNC